MSDMSNSDIDAARRGDRGAFERVLRAHYGMMFRVAYRYCGHTADAEDIAQEVCVGLAHKLSQFKGDSSFSTWLYRVVVNQCRDHQRRRTAGNAREVAYSELEAMAGADAKEANRRTAWLYRAIAALKPPLPETALLVLAEEKSHAEAGAILGCAESTISWRMAEIRKHLMTAMDGYHD